MVRLNLPNRNLDTLDIKLDGGSLHIIALAEKDAGHYEQALKLDNVKPRAVLQIERKPEEDLIAVTISKTSAVDRIFEDAFKDISPALLLESRSFVDSPRFGSSLDVQAAAMWSAPISRTATWKTSMSGWKARP